jgi:hypothetical protein
MPLDFIGVTRVKASVGNELSPFRLTPALTAFGFCRVLQKMLLGRSTYKVWF